MAVTSDFDRSWLPQVPGVFVSYGAGADVDAAFDDAALSDRFDYGTTGLVPSLATFDPAAEHDVHDHPVHRHLAWREALDFLTHAEPGALAAFAVAPLRDFKHRNAAVIVTDPAVRAPLEPIELFAYPELFAAATDLVELEAGEFFASASLPRMGSVRYKAAALSVPGPKVTRFGVYAAGTFEPISVHDSAPLAKKAALVLARDKAAGPLSLEVRPIVTKEGGQPIVAVSRAVVACKRPVKVLVASPKNPEKPVKTEGWVFAGRMA